MKYLTKIEQLEHLSPAEKAELKQVTDKFAFRSSDYYLSLIDWNDPDDPIRKLIIPNLQELDDYTEVIRDYPIDLPYRSYGPE